MLTKCSMLLAKAMSEHLSMLLTKLEAILAFPLGVPQLCVRICFGACFLERSFE